MHRRIKFCLHAFVLLATLVSLFAPFSAPAASAEPLVDSWIDAQMSDGVVYLLYRTSQIIKRYDVQSDAWLPDITLSGPPTAFTVGADAMYVGFGNRLTRLNLDGTGETHLMNAGWSIQSLHLDSGFLLLNCSSGLYANLVTYNLTTGAQIDTKSFYVFSMGGASYAPGIHKLFGRSSGISPADISMATLSADGHILSQIDSPYHGSYPSASKTWVSPNERIVIEDSGILYNTLDLTYRASFSGLVSDVAFYGDLPIVLRGDTLIAYSNTFLETGRYNPGGGGVGQDIFVVGETVYGFLPNFDASPLTTNPTVTQTPVSLLNPVVPGQAIDPLGLDYTPDAVEMGSNQVVYLLSKKHQSIFRWDVAARRYLPTIPLLDVPYGFALSEANHRIYTAYLTGAVNQIDLAGELVEKPFVNLPAAPCGLAAAGSFVFTCDGSGAWNTHTTFTPAGEVVMTKEWSHSSLEFIWNEATRKLFYFRDDTSPNDVLYQPIDASGMIGAEFESPYHGTYSMVHPLRVKPDGAYVVIGTGMIFDGVTLVRNNALSNEISDAGWKGDDLVTLRAWGSNAELQKWNPGTFGVTKSAAVTGSPVRVLPVSEGWLAITRSSGRVRFTLWSDDLDLLASAPLAAFSVDVTSGRVPLEVHFTNLSTEGPYTTSLWEFGDGATSSETSPTHTYTKNGRFTVRLTVSGPGGEDTTSIAQFITVLPVAASFSASVTRGEAPLEVKFTNLTQGGYDTALWSFGDGETSSEASPTHIYTAPGFYTVSLAVDGPYGSSTYTAPTRVEAFTITRQYLNMLGNPEPFSYLKPGVYPQQNVCKQFPLNIYGTDVGQMRECVTQVEIKPGGAMIYQFTWTLFKNPAVSECVIKYSDAGNADMYIRDSGGRVYHHTQAGGDQYIYCMANAVPYTGWFQFPPAESFDTTFNFVDDDAGIIIGPITLPENQ